MVTSVFIPVLGQDTGGQGVRIVEAFRRLDPSFEVRTMVSKQTYINYPTDLAYDLDEMRRLYNEADVIHVRNNFGAYQYFDHDQGKPAVIHHQGTAYRNRPHYMNAVCRTLGMVQCVSTIDLETIHGHTWLPSPFDVPQMVALGAEIRRTRVDTGEIVVSHAPTNRHIKGTRHVISAVSKLQREGLRVRLDLIEGRSWQECLTRKAQSDIYIDQFELGYGNNAIEAWLLGLPVIAGVRQSRVEKRMRELVGYLPFWAATEQNVVGRLRELVVSKDAREDAAGVGIGYARDFHDGERTVAILRDLWTSARPTIGSGGLARAEGRAMHPPRLGTMTTFRGSRYPALMVRIGDRKFKFVGGRLTVDDADAPLIDEFAARRPEYRIAREEPHVVPPAGDAADFAPPEEAYQEPAVDEADSEEPEADEAPVDVNVTANELRAELEAWDLKTAGSKDALWDRLDEAYVEAEIEQAEAEAVGA